LSPKKGARRKTLRYFRWAVKIIILLILVMPIRYFAHPGVYSLPISSLTFGVLNQPPICLSYGQSVCHFLLFSWVLTPGGWVACPVGGLQVLLTMGIVPQAGLDMGWLILSLAVAVLFFFVLTFFAGSMFCSWVCPLGTIIDGFDKAVERFMPKINMKREERLKRNREKNEKKSRFVCPTCPFGRILANKNATVANGILVSALVGAAILRVNVWCFICPIGILTQGMFHLKSVTRITRLFNHKIWNQIPPLMMPIMIELLAIPAIAVVLSLREKRYWCRKICPLGALVRFFAKFNPFFKPTIKSGKHTCQIDQRKCEKVCSQGIGPWRAKGSAECTKCLECYVECDQGLIEIKRFGTPDAVLWLRRFFRKLKRRLKKEKS